MTLKEFYQDPRNTVTREYMFTSKLQFDLMEAAARRGVALRTYIPTVDRDGFDIIFDDGQSLISVQLKTKITNVSRWKIHRNLYRPKSVDMETYNLHSHSHHSGMGGGVIVINITVDSNNKTSVSYMYSDFLILHMLKEGFFNKADLKNKLQDIYFSAIDDFSGKFTLKKIAFIEAFSPDHLLNLMGLQSIYNNMWRYEYMEYIQDKNNKHYHSSWTNDLDNYEKAIKKTLHKIGYTSYLN